MAAEDRRGREHPVGSGSALPMPGFTMPPTPKPPMRPARKLLLAGLLAALCFVAPLLALTALRMRGASHAQSTARTSAVLVGHSGTWINTQQTTPINPANAGYATQQVAVDAAFQTYYAAHDGPTQLGPARTPAFASSIGWLQFFTRGALVTTQGTYAPQALAAASSDQLRQLLAGGIPDSATGVTRLPLIQALLTSGSQVHIGGDTSSVTYADLRNATLPHDLVAAPKPPAVGATQQADNVFVPEGTSQGKTLGHNVPNAILSYLNDPAVAPDGWHTDFGLPVTEAVPLTLTQDGAPHHALVQVFWSGAVLLDTSALDANGQPTVSTVNTGLDYLSTFGAPTAIVTPRSAAWTTGDAAVLAVPGSGSAEVHLGAAFPLTLTGASQWHQGTLWYAVDWKSAQRNGAGWAPASAVSASAPAAGTIPTAQFDALSPDLAAYLADRGVGTGAVVYDVTRNQYYLDNENTAYTGASSMKVPIMLTFLATTESQNREPDGDEQELLTTMIENSDNDAAQALYEEEGGPAAIDAFMSNNGVSGISMNTDAWGWSTITPLAMVKLLTLLHAGKILTAQDRALALNLLYNIESDQQDGVGDTAPNGATVAMKDGWVPGPDGLWAMNSSGIVTAGGETYIIAVYSQELDSYDWSIANTVCSDVAHALA